MHFAHAAKVSADGQIAVIACVNDPVLVTGNVKDFARFKGLRVTNRSKAQTTAERDVRCYRVTGQIVKSRRARRSIRPPIARSAACNSSRCARPSSRPCSFGWCLVPCA